MSRKRPSLGAGAQTVSAPHERDPSTIDRAVARALRLVTPRVAFALGAAHRRIDSAGCDHALSGRLALLVRGGPALPCERLDFLILPGRYSTHDGQLGVLDALPDHIRGLMIRYTGVSLDEATDIQDRSPDPESPAILRLEPLVVALLRDWDDAAAAEALALGADVDEICWRIQRFRRDLRYRLDRIVEHRAAQADGRLVTTTGPIVRLVPRGWPTAP